MALTSITKDFVIKSGALTEGTSFVSSSTGQTATLQVNGGVAIAKNLIVGTTSTIWGNETIYGTQNVTGLATFGGVTAQLTTATQLNITGISTFGGNTLFNGSVNTFSGALFVTGTNILTVGTGQASFGGGVSIAGVTSITNGTAVGSGVGALVVTGGEYVSGALWVNSSAYNTATNTANAIYTPGGIYADGGLTVGSSGPVLFKGPVTFSGTATYVLSTNTYYTDNLLELHTPPAGVYGSWFTDDGKDIGLRFHYYTNSTDTNAALVLANDTKYLEWYNAGAEGTSTFAGSSYGTFKTGAIKLVGGNGNQANTSTGDLTVLGGVGVGGSIYVAGNVTATTFIGALTGTASNATNINGGAAGSLVYQSAASTTALLPIGTNGYILTVAGGNPSWAAVSGLSAGNATTATNIAGGAADQIPYQSAPGQTVFSSALRFNGTTFTATNVWVSGTSNATGYNNNTGALIVKGGAAINNDLWVGGDINLQGSLYLKGVGLDQITGSTGTFDYVFIEGTGTGLTVYDQAIIGNASSVYSIVNVSSTNTGALQVKGGLGVWGGGFFSGQVTATTANITGNETVGGNLSVTGYGTISGGSTISALTVTNAATVGTSLAVTGFSSLSGGATISAATVTNTLVVSSTNATNGAATGGAVAVSGGLGLSKDLYVGTTATVVGITYHSNTTPSLGSASAGSVQTTGGVGIAKDLYVGTTATIGGSASVTGFSSLSGGATISALTVTNAATVGTSLAVTGFSSLNGGATLSAATVTNNLTVSGNETVTGYLTVNGGSTISALTVTNAATVGTSLAVTGFSSLNGGATISAATVTNNASVGGTLTVTGYSTLGLLRASDTTVTNLTVTGTATLPTNVSLTNLTVTNLTVNGNEVISTGNLSVGGVFTSTGAATFSSTIGASGIVSITNTTDSNATNNGALIVSGGVGIAKNLVVGTAVTVAGTTTATTYNAFYSNNTLYSSYTSNYIVSNAAINLDTYSSTTYRTAKYLVQIVDGTKIHVEEIVVFHDGTNVYMTEYAIATSQGELGTFDAGLASNTITLTFTANYTPTNMTIKMSRQTITL